MQQRVPAHAHHLRPVPIQKGSGRLPHLGRHPETGVVYALGYCGTGVALSTHFGRAVGRWLCGDGELPAFSERRWPIVPPPAHVPWLLPVAGWWYQARDALGR